MRGVAILAVALLVASDAPASAYAQGMTPEQYRRGFTEAARCFAVLGYARKDRIDHGDPERARFYESKADEAFNAAFAAGRLGGRSSSEVESDIYKLADGEFPKIIADVGYYKSAAARCKAIGYL